MRADDFVAELAKLETDALEVTQAHQESDDEIAVHFRSKVDDEIWQLKVPSWSSAKAKPWLYREPTDFADSARMLGIYLDEEILTTAINKFRAPENGLAGRIEFASGFLRKSR